MLKLDTRIEILAPSVRPIATELVATCSIIPSLRITTDLLNTSWKNHTSWMEALQHCSSKDELIELLGQMMQQWMVYEKNVILKERKERIFDSNMPLNERAEKFEDGLWREPLVFSYLKAIAKQAEIDVQGLEECASRELQRYSDFATLIKQAHMVGHTDVPIQIGMNLISISLGETAAATYQEQRKKSDAIRHKHASLFIPLEEVLTEALRVSIETGHSASS
jgi:hypothetical protein